LFIIAADFGRVVGSNQAMCLQELLLHGSYLSPHQ